MRGDCETTEDSGGGESSWAFGSRFNGLNLDQPELDWTQRQTRGKNRGTKGSKRTAVRETHREHQFTKHLRVESTPAHNGPRYLILKRTDERTTMTTVSPFFIRKAMDCITPNVTITRTKDGGLLLKTVDKQQALKLLKQKVLGETINIEIVEHPTLNTTRGTIFCPDLKMHTDEEITEELKDSHVVNVKRIRRRKGQDFEDSGAFILTFNLGILPSSIDAGIHICKVRQYIPAPLRCMNCLKFGHKRDACRGNQICANCANLYHDKTDCQQGAKCVVCRGDHHALSKDCPVFIDEFEIQRMKVTEKITYREARQKRRLQAPDPNPPRLRQLFSSQLKIQNHNNNEEQQWNPVSNNSTRNNEDNPRDHQHNQSCQISKTTDSNTQMNTTMTYTNINATGNSSGKQDIHEQYTDIQNEHTKSQSSLINEGTTNTTTNNSYRIEMNTVDSNITNTIAEIENLNSLSQAISRSILIEEIDVDNIQI